jgi:hypothetical protein
MPLSYYPFVNGATLGVSPEQLNQYFQQFTADGFPEGMMNCGVMSDMAVVLTVTSAQLLALQNTAVQLVAPPIIASSGALTYLVPPRGYIFIPTTLTMEYVYGGTAYTIAGTTPFLTVEYTGQTTALLQISPTGLVDQVVNRIATVATTSQAAASLTVNANLGLELKLTGTTPSLTLGNGTVTVTLLYNILALL